MKPLTIFLDDDGVFTDWTQLLKSFIKDDVTHTFVTNEDFIYLGLYKRFSGPYVEMSTFDTLGVWEFEYYNGTTFVAIPDFVDDTLNLSRSGLLSWDREISDWALTTVNTKELFWIRLKPTTDSSAITIEGIAKIFSTDDDLEEEYPGISKFRPKSSISFISYHQASREEIIQTIRNSGKFKRSTRSDKSTFDEEINEWDLLIEEQFKQSSKHLVLSKVFFQKSDNIEDKYYQLYKDYRDKHLKAFNLFYETIDFDDDGIVDDNERLKIKAIRIQVL